MRALVVVDMQDGFGGAGVKSIQDACCDLLLNSKRDGDLIFILEYAGCGVTYKNILGSVFPYDKVYSITKEADDGSTGVLDMLKYLGQKIKEFLVCGVNASACVSATVEGLTDLTDAEITVVKEATGNDPGWVMSTPDPYYAIRHTIRRNTPRVKLVSLEDIIPPTVS